MPISGKKDDEVINDDEIIGNKINNVITHVVTKYLNTEWVLGIKIKSCYFKTNLNMDLPTNYLISLFDLLSVI